MGLVVAAVIVAVAGTAGVLELRRQADASRRSQLVLSHLATEVHHSGHLAWRGVVERSRGGDTRAQISANRRAIARLVEEASDSGVARPTVDRVRRSSEAYEHVLTSQYSLVMDGRIGEAAVLNKSEVAPAFEDLDSAIEGAIESQEEAATFRIRAADAGTLLVLVGMLSAIGLLMRRFEHVRAAAHDAETEHAALARSEAHFRGLVQYSFDLTLVIDREARIRYASDSSERMLGIEAEELVGRRLFEIVRRCDADIVRDLMDTCLDRPDCPPVADFHVRHADGGWRRLEAVFDDRLDDPSMDGIIVNMWDVTDRKAMEERIRLQNSQLGLRNAELAALYEISEAAARADNLTDLLNNVLAAISRVEVLKEYEKSGILIVEGDRMRLAAYTEGAHNEEFLRIHEDIRVGDCLCGLAAETGDVVISGDAYEDDRHTVVYLGMPNHGHVIVPLKVMGRVVGVLYTYRPPGAKVDEDSIMLLKAIGDRVGTAIENVRLYEQAKEMSLHDPLTGLANRRLLDAHLEQRFATARRVGRTLSVIMLDLDHFKRYNDAYGHAAGDRLLADVAHVISSEVREMDLVARYGGEEFVVVLDEQDSDEAMAVAERIRAKVMGTAFHHDGVSARVTITAGVAAFDEATHVAEDLVRTADRAMYAAKRAGRNRVWLAAA